MKLARHLFTAAAMAFFSCMQAGHASTFPERGITIVNPFPPGSPVDFLGRLVASELDALWDPYVVVENKTGAGGTVGTNYVVKSKPDGHTLLVTTPSPLSVASSLYASLPYDPVKGVIPIWGVMTGGQAIVVNADLPVRSVKELIDLAKENPNKLTYASSGIGTLQHFAGELFKAKTGVELLHVPYRGGAPAAADLVGGHVHVMFDSLNNQMPHIEAGKVRPLALLRPVRDSRLPEVPTTKEEGFPDVTMVSWISIFAPAGTPSETVQKLRKTISQVMSEPRVMEVMEATLGDIEILSGEDLEVRLQEESTTYKAIAEMANMPKQ